MDWKKTFSLIGLSVLVVAVIAAVSVVQKQQIIERRAAETTVLSMSPSSVTVGTGGNFSISLDIDTGDNSVVGTQMYIDFDPSLLQAESVELGSFFPSGEIQSQNIDNTTGRVTVVVFEPLPAGSPQVGTGTVARVNFTAVAAGIADLAYGPDTIVAAVGEDVGQNVLQLALGATVTISTATPDTTMRFIPRTNPVDVGQIDPVDIYINTGINNVIGVELVVDYDETRLTALGINDGGFFPNGQVSVNDIDLENGIITFVIYEPIPDGVAQNGTGILATIDFTTTNVGTANLSHIDEATANELRLNYYTLVAGTGSDAGVNLLADFQPVDIVIQAHATATPTNTPTPTITVTNTPTNSPTSTPTNTATVTPTTFCGVADINCDSCVNLLDYSIMFEAFGATCSISQEPPVCSTNWDARADLVMDEVINLLDYSVLFENFQTSCNVI